MQTPTRITLMGTEPNRPRCNAWCAHPLDVHGAYGCDTDDCRCGRTGETLAMIAPLRQAESAVGSGIRASGQVRYITVVLVLRAWAAC